MSPRLAIVGYGLMGRLLAWQASQADCHVRVFEQLSIGAREQSSFAAGGMLAPFSEMEQSEDLIFQLGMKSLKLWPSWIQSLGNEIHYHQAGSLIVAHPRDRALWLDYQEKSCRLAKSGQFQKVSAHELEPEISAQMSQGLFFPLEQHLDPKSLLTSLDTANLARGVTVNYDQQMEPEQILALKNDFDWVIDCRGIGARDSLVDLRGVRGEALLVHARDVKISRPIRLLHPRYALYVVPRADQHYYLGATQIESESLEPISVRSSLELLSAAFTLHSGFAEAQVLRSYVGLRPALPHHRPQIWVREGSLVINGLFRHGFLLGPAIVQAVMATIIGQKREFISSKIFVHAESKYETHC